MLAQFQAPASILWGDLTREVGKWAEMWIMRQMNGGMGGWSKGGVRARHGCESTITASASPSPPRNRICFPWAIQIWSPRREDCPLAPFTRTLPSPSSLLDNVHPFVSSSTTRSSSTWMLVRPSIGFIIHLIFVVGMDVRSYVLNNERLLSNLRGVLFRVSDQYRNVLEQLLMNHSNKKVTTMGVE